MTNDDEFKAILNAGGQLPRKRPSHIPNQAKTDGATKSPRGGSGSRSHAGDRFKVANAFADYSANTVSTTAQAVWFHLWREVKPNGIARISQGHLARKIGKSLRTVARAIDELKKAKLITVVKKGGPQAGIAGYRVHGVPGGSVESQRRE